LNQRVKSYDSQAKSDLRNLANFEEIYLTDFGVYGTMAEIQANEPSLAISKNDTLTIVHYNGVVGYCLSAQRLGSPNTWYYDSSGGGLQPLGGTCTAVTAGPNGGSVTG
jgi:hypothetical protein